MDYFDGATLSKKALIQREDFVVGLLFTVFSLYNSCCFFLRYPQKQLDLMQFLFVFIDITR